MSQVFQPNKIDKSFHEQNDQYLGIKEQIQTEKQNIELINDHRQQPQKCQQISQHKDQQSEHQQENNHYEKDNTQSDHQNVDQYIKDKSKETQKQSSQMKRNDRKQVTEKQDDWNNEDQVQQKTNKTQNVRSGRRGQKKDDDQQQNNEQIKEQHQQITKPQQKKIQDSWDIVQQQPPPRNKRGVNAHTQQKQIQKDKQSNSSWNNQQKNQQYSKKSSTNNRGNHNQDARRSRKNNQDDQGLRKNDHNQDYQRRERNWKSGNQGFGNNSNRNNRDEQGDRGNRGNREDRNNNKNDNRNDNRKGDRNYGGGDQRRDNNNHYKINIENPSKLQHQKQAQNKQKKPTPIQIKPLGQRCWPQLSIYIKKTRLSLTYREITQHKCDILVFPFMDLKFNVYPSGLINKFTQNYRDKIKQKISNTFGTQNADDGWTYFKQCNDFQQFNAVIFVKINQKCQLNPPILKRVLNGAQTLKNSKSQLTKQAYSMLIPYSNELGQFSQCLKSIVEKIDKTDSLDQVIITTNNKQNSITLINQFTNFITTLISDNMIAI